jgi:DUF1009 family protein
LETLGLIAGNGVFPLMFAREARERGFRVVAVAHTGETPAAIEEVADAVTWIRVGRLGRMIRAFRAAGVRRAVMCGGLNKVRSLADLRPDWRTLRLLARTGGRGDDTLLRALARELGGAGIEVVSSTLFLDRILAPAGLLAGPVPDAAARADLALGVRVLEATGPLDIGQSVVVERGVVLALEAIEGTDAAIARAGALGRGGAVVVKMAKRGQDMRFDVPAVGPGTITAMRAAGARLLAVEAGATILLEAEGGSATSGASVDLCTLAAASGISLVGCDRAGHFEGWGEGER